MTPMSSNLSWGNVGAHVAPLKNAAGAAIVAIGLVAALVGSLGASPVTAVRALVNGSVGSSPSLGQTVMITSVLALTGLASAVPFTARMLNVGAEGQLYAGAIAAIAVGLSPVADLPEPLPIVLLVLAGMVAGALWAALPGLLRAYLGANEVIASLMLTFVAVLLVDYATKSIWPSGLAQNTRPLPDQALLPELSSSTNITLGAPLAAVAVLCIWLVMKRGSLGFQIRATGLGVEAARMNGTPIARVWVLSFALGGAAAGLGGVVLVAGIHGTLIANGAAGLGFLGIAVALVARLNPAWIVPSALLFASLRVGGSALQVEAGISAATGELLVGVLVISLLAAGTLKISHQEAAA